jgi:hypothetical protein
MVVTVYVTLNHTPRIFQATAAFRDGCTPFWVICATARLPFD